MPLWSPWTVAEPSGAGPLSPFGWAEANGMPPWSPIGAETCGIARAAGPADAWPAPQNPSNSENIRLKTVILGSPSRSQDLNTGIGTLGRLSSDYDPIWRSHSSYQSWGPSGGNLGS